MKRVDLIAKYFESDYWVRKEGNIFLVGVTDFAQEFFRNLTNIELPDVETRFSKKEVFCTVESDKSTYELHLPISGLIVEVNETLIKSPSKINKFPYESWIVKLKDVSEEDWEALSAVEDYKEFLRVMFNKS